MTLLSYSRKVDSLPVVSTDGVYPPSVQVAGRIHEIVRFLCPVSYIYLTVNGAHPILRYILNAKSMMVCEVHRPL